MPRSPHTSLVSPDIGRFTEQAKRASKGCAHDRVPHATQPMLCLGHSEEFGVNGTFSVSGNLKRLATFQLTRGEICLALS